MVEAGEYTELINAIRDSEGVDLIDIVTVTNLQGEGVRIVKIQSPPGHVWRGNGGHRLSVAGPPPGTTGHEPTPGRWRTTAYELAPERWRDALDTFRRGFLPCFNDPCRYCDGVTDDRLYRLRGDTL